MIENKLIQKMVKQSLGSKKKRIVDRDIMHPERDWFFGVMVGLVICSLGAWWSVYSYLGYSNNVNVESLVEDTNVVVYRAGVVNEVLKDFSEKEATYNKIIESLKSPVEDNKESTSKSSVVGGSEATSIAKVSDTPSETSSLEEQVDSVIATSTPEIN